MADISFISAGIGGGKSLFGARQIAQELARTERMIVTNLPLIIEDAPEGFMTVGEWCHEYVDRAIDVRSRLYVIPQDSQRDVVPEFYRYYPPPGGSAEPFRLMPWLDERDNVPDLEWRARQQATGEMPAGCLFVIDEAHFFFDSRQWQKVGRGVGFYRSQLRKLNDDLLLLTQHVEKVDKNFRRDATEFIYLTNFSKRRLFGGVTLDGRFRFASYPTVAQRGDNPTSSGWLQLKDKEYQKIYRTMAGVGLTGTLAPEGNRFKGRHWTVWVVMLVVFALFCWYVPRAVLHGVNKVLLHAMGGAREEVGRMVGKAPGMAAIRAQETNQGGDRPVPAREIPLGAMPPRIADIPSRNELTEGRLRWQDDIIVEGVAVVEGLVRVWLSDGASYTLGDGHFTEWRARVAVIDGYAYRFLTIAERAAFERRKSLKILPVDNRNGGSKRAQGP